MKQGAACREHGGGLAKHREQNPNYCATPKLPSVAAALRCFLKSRCCLNITFPFDASFGAVIARNGCLSLPKARLLLY